MGQFWPPVPRPVVSGTVSVPALSAGAVSAAIPITFAGFTSPPRIVPVPGGVRLNYAASSVTAVGADLYAANWSPSFQSASTLGWIAQPL